MAASERNMPSTAAGQPRSAISSHSTLSAEAMSTGASASRKDTSLASGEELPLEPLQPAGRMYSSPAAASD